MPAVEKLICKQNLRWRCVMPLEDFIIYVYCCLAAAIFIMKSICFSIDYKIDNDLAHEARSDLALH